MRKILRNIFKSQLGTNKIRRAFRRFQVKRYGGEHGYWSMRSSKKKKMSKLYDNFAY